MRKKPLKKLVLTPETLRILSDSRTKGVAGHGIDFKRVTDECDTEDNTCYWGCSFSCPDGGCREV